MLGIDTEGSCLRGGGVALPWQHSLSALLSTWSSKVLTTTYLTTVCSVPFSLYGGTSRPSRRVSRANQSIGTVISEVFLTLHTGNGAE